MEQTIAKRVGDREIRKTRMAGLVHCIYTSVQRYALGPDEIDELILHSRRSNEQNDISGILLHVGATFFQVLEGSPEKVQQLYSKILNDRRHIRISQIIYEPIAHRFFADSTMSLATLSPRELAVALNDASVADAEDLLDELDEGRAKRILRAFAQGRWRARVDLHGREHVAVYETK